jgi:hypothetical protein
VLRSRRRACGRIAAGGASGDRAGGAGIAAGSASGDRAGRAGGLVWRLGTRRSGGWGWGWGRSTMKP